MMRAVASVAAVLFLCSASLAFDHDESVDGPLSGDPANPTLLSPVLLGSNTVTGSVASASNPADYFAFAVPTGSSLEAIILDDLDPGADFWFDVRSLPGGEILYTGETDQENLGLNLLPAMGLAPLPAGSYRFAFGYDDVLDQAYALRFEIGREIVYVDRDATGANDGTSWCDAYPFLQDALAAAGTHSKIRVAEGTYRPDRNSTAPSGTVDRLATFDLAGNVFLQGGYAGCGATDPDERDLALHETVLSGDLAGNDGPDFANYEENSYHVVTAEDPAGTVILDGFSISGGYANETGTSAQGAGLKIVDGHAEVVHCTFLGNQTESTEFWSSSGAAALSAYDASSVFNDCTFIENRAMGEYAIGGALDVYTAQIDHCKFVSNSAAWSGGAIFGDGQITSSVFVDNQASGEGGAYARWGGGPIVNSVFVGNAAAYGGGLGDHDSSPTVVNSVFVGNSASVEGGGAAITDDNSVMTIINCTFAENHSDGRGAGLTAPSWAGYPDVSGSIFWGNRDSVGQDEYAQIYPVDDPSYTIIHYSVVQGWTGIFGGMGNNGDTPQFVGGPTGSWTADATRNSLPGQTTLYDGNATYGVDELAGKFLNPDTSQGRQTLIVSNSATEITVWGDFTTLGLTGADYRVGDFRLSLESPCIDAGDNTAMLADTLDLDQDGDSEEPIPFDCDGEARFSDDPCTAETGNGDPPVVDRGAYEFRSDSLDLSIGDRVWADLDGDGVQDEGEPGLGSALVYLYDHQGLIQEFDLTNALGEYVFADLDWSSEYSVRFIPSADYRLTDQDQGMDDHLDSDADPDTGFTPNFQLCDLGNAALWDAGMVSLVPCIRPDEPIYLYAMTLDDNQNPVLHFMDPNQPAQITGYNVYRSANAAIPKVSWPQVASNVIDMDEAAPNKQWVDFSGQDPPPPWNLWYYQITAYNGPPCDQEGPFGWPLERNCDNGLDDDLDTLVDCEDPDCARACDPPPIELGDSWRFFRGYQEPTSYDPSTAHWAQLDFDDSGWEEGPSGFGYGTDCAAFHGTVLNDMQYGYVSLYVRTPFYVEDPTLLSDLTLTVDYDDGWVAYLNGVEVARSLGMGGTVGVPPTFDQTTQTGDHECSGSPGAANPPEPFELGDSIGLLVPGTNVLALQGHNRGLVSSDFSLIPILAGTQ
jgi:predicted outer membrane repeat protein